MLWQADRICIACVVAAGCAEQPRESTFSAEVNALLSEAANKVVLDHRSNAGAMELADPVPGANQFIVAPGLGRIFAALSTQSAGTVFRASVTPGEFVDDKYDFPMSIVEDAQISLSTDTSTAATSGSKTTVALATYLYNPFSLRGPMAERGLMTCQGRLTSEVLAVDSVCQSTAYLAKYKECVEGSERTAMATCSHISIDSGGVCSLVQGPANALTQCGNSVRQLLTATCVSTEKEHALTSCAATRAQDKVASENAAKVCRRDKFTQLNNKLLACQWRELTSQYTPQIQVSVSGSIFPFGYFNDPTAKNSGIAQPFAGLSTQITTTFRPHERVSMSMWGTYQYARSNSAPGTRLDNYAGAAVQLAWMFHPFLDSAHLRFDSKADATANANYVKTGYVPGLVLGVSAQFLVCVEGNGSCSQSVPTQWSVAPFLDTKISPTVQFRFGVQVSQGPIVDSAAVAVSPFVSAASSF